MENNKLQKISNILKSATAAGDELITRKEMISLAKAVGLVEKDCYFVITNSAKCKSARGTYFISIMNDIVNRSMKKNETVTTMRDILYGYSSKGHKEISRQGFIADCVEAGLVERDTYRLTISANKSAKPGRVTRHSRGWYSITHMIATAEKFVGSCSLVELSSILERGRSRMPAVDPIIEAAPAPANNNVDLINAIFDQIIEEEAILAEAAAQPTGKSYGYAPLAPNEADIADELALMTNTY
mgnify:CR=1 FL=1